MIPGLHADHIDTTGAYGKKFEVVKDLLESGVLKEIPEGFRDEEQSSNTKEVAEVITNSQTIGGYEEFDMSNGHADHVDSTGRYAKAYEEKYGLGSLNVPEEQGAGSSWKSFLQKIIAEEKSKLKV